MKRILNVFFVILTILNIRIINFLSSGYLFGWDIGISIIYLIISFAFIILFLYIFYSDIGYYGNYTTFNKGDNVYGLFKFSTYTLVLLICSASGFLIYSSYNLKNIKYVKYNDNIVVSIDSSYVRPKTPTETRIVFKCNTYKQWHTEYIDGDWNEQEIKDGVRIISYNIYNGKEFLGHKHYVKDW